LNFEAEAVEAATLETVKLATEAVEVEVNAEAGKSKPLPVAGCAAAAL